jgi:hypothetical protein
MTAVFAAALVWLCALPAQADGWRRISESDGVTVETRDVTGKDFPQFRGHAVLHFGLLDLAAIIADLDRTCQWTSRCALSKELSRKGEFERVFYTRTAAPWPSSDRDAVLHAVVVGNIAEGKDVNITFEAAESPLMPVQAGVVRMTQIRGHYHLTYVGPSETRIEFLVQADPGGWLPGWMVRMLSKAIPRDTIVGLRRQAGKVQGRYDAMVSRWQTGGR